MLTLRSLSLAAVPGALLLGLILSGQQPPALVSVPAPVPAALLNYSAVTAQRLLKPADGDWLMLRRTYDGWGYSPLDQISTSNVKSLKPVWVLATGETRPHEAAPIVNGGVMFVTTAMNQVIAIDVRSGNVLWRYRRPRPAGAQVPHEVNRGVALLGDHVYWAAGETASPINCRHVHRAKSSQSPLRTISNSSGPIQWSRFPNCS